MTLNEFKAWLEGFDAAFADGAPNPEQWAVVKAKLAQVSDLPVLAPRYPSIEPQSPTVKPWWDRSPIIYSDGGASPGERHKVTWYGFPTKPITCMEMTADA